MTQHDRDKLNRMLNGSREIVNDDFMDRIADADESTQIRTAMNRQRCGIHDQYVAWITDSAKPPDLEFADVKGRQVAIASR